MSTWFFSDPHLGLERASHTTPASRAQLKQKMHLQALRCFREGEPVYCLGDLFDTENNDEAVILQGLAVVNGIAGVIAGNHDCPNRDGRASSLQLIQSVCPDKVIAGSVNESGFDIRDGEIVSAFVPHMATQSLFDQSLNEVKAYCQEVFPGETKPVILCLHCNYDSGFADNAASLNLTRDKADELLQVFDYVLLGHEHIPRSDFGGRLQILGNTYPTKFSDISDKFMWEFRDGQLIPHKIWDKDAGYVRLLWEDLLSLTASDWADGKAEFVEVVGTAPADRMPEIAKRISDIWKDAPDLLMIRNAVQVEQGHLPQVDGSVTKLQDLPSRVAAELKDMPEILNLWKEYVIRLDAA